MFNDHELELLISGLPEIDVADLRAHTEYTGYTPAAKQIQWFWEVVSALSKEDLALLVQFTTGTSKVPLEGFKALQVLLPANLCVTALLLLWAGLFLCYIVCSVFADICLLTCRASLARKSSKYTKHMGLKTGYQAPTLASIS